MKKRIAAFFMAVAALSLAACATDIEKYDGQISEIRDTVMTAESDGMSVTLMSGEREEPFSIDGTAAGRIEFCIVTVKPASYDKDAVYTYTLETGGKTYGGSLGKHPYGETYSAEVEGRAGAEASVTVTKSNETPKTFELSNVAGEGAIDCGTALELALIRLSDSIKPLKQGGKLNAEIFIRFIENPISTDKAYYWYVAVLPDDKTVYAALIDPYTQEIVAVRE